MLMVYLNQRTEKKTKEIINQRSIISNCDLGIIKTQSFQINIQLSLKNHTPLKHTCSYVCVLFGWGSPGSSVGRALDFLLEGCRFESGTGRSMWDCFYIFCSVCRLCLFRRDTKPRSWVNRQKLTNTFLFLLLGCLFFFESKVVGNKLNPAWSTPLLDKENSKVQIARLMDFQMFLKFPLC